MLSMNNRIFISFLGTSDYKDTCYYFDNPSEPGDKVKYVQTTTAKKSGCARHLIFCTPKAEKMHAAGLEEEFKRFGITSLKFIKNIPEGSSEEELWNIFDIVRKEIPENAEIVFDITHSFRFLPMLMTILLNYLKEIKQVSLAECYYGAWEAGDPKPNFKEKIFPETAPIFNLAPFFVLNEWARAVTLFEKSGNATEIENLVEMRKRYLFCRQKPKSEQDFLVKMKNACSYASGLTEAILLCRMNGIKETEIAEKFNLVDISGMKSEIAPFEPIFEKMKSIFKDYKKGDLGNCFRAVEWCLEHNLYQQGYTLALETLVTSTLEKWEKDLHKKEILDGIIKREKPESENKCMELKRDIVSRVLRKDTHKALEENEHKALCDGITEDYQKEFRNISERRNDINHAGIGADPIKQGNVKKHFSGCIHKLKALCPEWPKTETENTPHPDRSSSPSKVLVGNSFPLSLIRQNVEMRPMALSDFPRDAEIRSFWGHTNTLQHANAFLGVDLTPKTERPALALSENDLPQLNGEEFQECWVISPNYVENFRAKIGEEIPAEKIKDWSLLKITWLS